MFLVSTWRCLCQIHWIYVLSRDWRCRHLSMPLQLHLSDQQFYCLLRSALYKRFDSIFRIDSEPVIHKRCVRHYNWVGLGHKDPLSRFVVTVHEGACEQEVRSRGCSHIPECMVTAHTHRSVIITIVTCHFPFYLVNFTTKCEYGVQRESRFACFSHYCVTWCLLTTGIVDSQCSSSKDAVLVTRQPTPLISACLNLFKNSTTIKHIYNEFVNIIEGCNVTFDTNDCCN